MTSLTHALSSLSEKATQGEWKWHWRSEDGIATGSIYSEVRQGHAYSIAVTPRYQKQPQWEADAALAATLVNAWRSGRLRVSDELDAATVERCAQVAIRLNGWGSPPRHDIAEHIASAIRSLIPNSANEIHSSDGGVEGHARQCGPADTVNASKLDVNRMTDAPLDAKAGNAQGAGIKPGPSEAICTFPYDWSGKSPDDPAVTQDCAPAGTVSEEAPFAYAYVYLHWDGKEIVRFSDGREINGSKPIRSIPLYTHPSLSQFDVRRK